MSFSNDQLKYFAKFIEGELGIIYTDTNFFQLEHRLNDISIQLGLHSSEELWKKAQEGIIGNFKDLLLDIATNNETSFFRDTGVFKAFEQAIIPEILSHEAGISKIKIWSAACSTGQEPYSITILLENMLKSGKVLPDYSIIASDFSDRVLNRAKSGIFTQLEVQRGLPARFLIAYFEKMGETQWKINPYLTSKIKFTKINLLDPWFHAEPLDVVFCRNVLIYQSVENKTAVIAKIAQNLKPKGYLILGAAESLLGVSDEFEQLSFENSVYYRKK